MSKRYGRVLAGLVRGLTAPQHRWRKAHTRLRVVEALRQSHIVTTAHGTLTFVSTDPKALWYPQHHGTREPETIAWIDGFEPPCVYWDVGANVGQFALYAALRRGVSVMALEPSAASYAALCRNIEANGCSERVQAFCFAANDRTELGALNLSGTEAGSVLNAFDDTEDCLGRPLDIRFRQPTIGFPIDEFRRMFDLPPPNYLKIDVDGNEERILDGAAVTLRDPALRSILIEIEEEESSARRARMAERLERAGFLMTHRGIGQGGAANAVFVRTTPARSAAHAAQ